jgi:hypothetical protein
MKFKIMQIRVTEDEYALVKAEAADVGRNINSYIRGKINLAYIAGHPKPSPRPILDEEILEPEI